MHGGKGKGVSLGGIDKDLTVNVPHPRRPDMSDTLQAISDAADSHARSAASVANAAATLLRKAMPQRAAPQQVAPAQTAPAIMMTPVPVQSVVPVVSTSNVMPAYTVKAKGKGHAFFG